MMVGWYEDSRRHSLARQGIKTGRKITDTRSFANWAKEKGRTLWEKEKELYPKQKEWVKKETDVVAEKLGQAYEWEKERLPEQTKFFKEIITIPKESEITTDKNDMDITKEYISPEQIAQLEEEQKEEDKIVIVTNKPENVKIVGSKTEQEEVTQKQVSGNFTIGKVIEEVVERPKFAKDFDRTIWDY